MRAKDPCPIKSFLLTSSLSQTSMSANNSPLILNDKLSFHDGYFPASVWDLVLYVYPPILTKQNGSILPNVSVSWESFALNGLIIIVPGII